MIREVAMESTRTKCVFLVDDEPKVLRAVRETLGTLDVRITCFSRASACLEQLRSQDCDLLIADLKMPEMDGVELLKRSKQLIPWLPVLIMTGYGSSSVAAEVMNLGAVDLLEKPLVKDDFLQKIKDILRRNAPDNTRVTASLTDREIEVLKLVAAGKANKEIADLLDCSESTIEIRRAQLMKKCRVNNVVDLVKRASTMGLVDLPSKRAKSIAHPHRQEFNVRQ